MLRSWKAEASNIACTTKKKKELILDCGRLKPSFPVPIQPLQHEFSSEAPFLESKSIITEITARRSTMTLHSITYKNSED